MTEQAKIDDGCARRVAAAVAEFNAAVVSARSVGLEVRCIVEEIRTCTSDASYPDIRVTVLRPVGPMRAKVPHLDVAVPQSLAELAEAIAARGSILVDEYDVLQLFSTSGVFSPAWRDAFLQEYGVTIELPQGIGGPYLFKKRASANDRDWRAAPIETTNGEPDNLVSLANLVYQGGSIALADKTVARLFPAEDRIGRILLIESFCKQYGIIATAIRDAPDSFTFAKEGM